MREAHWGRGAKPLSIGSEEESEGGSSGRSGEFVFSQFRGWGKVMEWCKGVGG